MKNPRLNAFIEFFEKQGVKFIDSDTGEEIKPAASPTIKCTICGNETPKGQEKCMWCQNNMKGVK